MLPDSVLLKPKARVADAARDAASVRGRDRATDTVLPTVAAEGRPTERARVPMLETETARGSPRESKRAAVSVTEAERLRVYRRPYVSATEIASVAERLRGSDLETEPDGLAVAPRAHDSARENASAVADAVERVSPRETPSVALVDTVADSGTGATSTESAPLEATPAESSTTNVTGRVPGGL